MSSEGYSILSIPLPDVGGLNGAKLLLAHSGPEVNLDPDSCDFSGGSLPKDWRGSPVDDNDHFSPISLHENPNGIRIRLLETRTYDWALDGEGTDHLVIHSPLEDNRRQRWSVRRQRNAPPSGSFSVINHLGLAVLDIKDSHGELILSVPLEFISNKLDFDSEYRRMTEDIAEFCEQLLLSWDAPTSLVFSPSLDKEARLILEQFLFLRHFLIDVRLGLLLEVIGRNPHSQLKAIHTWTPAALARSSNHLSNPGTMVRDWHQHNGRQIPGEVLDVRKEDNRDTPPNRFLKFALNSFRSICQEVAEVGGANSQTGAEASDLRIKLDAILARRFFQGIGQVKRLPLDNQTLQKGTGYREILRAWILTRAAASLNWEGQQDSYEGSSRDVATLYEYWIFLKLYELLEAFPGMKKLDEGKNADSFISGDAKGIKLNLRSGKHSLSSFVLNEESENALKVELHYERTFFPTTNANSGSSYSRHFRPDYTLSIYPASFASEKLALSEGQSVHLHFDAKYRAEKLAQIFGGADSEDLTEEKISGKASGTYKRGDLLKMHTYNDALRQTIGSYVLYPGDQEATEMRKFHEIAPGVGAFVMKPGNDECLEAISHFLRDVFEHQKSKFTQFRYLSDASFSTHLHPPGTLKEDGSTYQVAKRDASCVILWLKKETEAKFRAAGFAYCQVTRKEAERRKLNLNLTTELGSEFIPSGGGQGRPLTGHGWRAKIKAARFISREKLIEYILNKKLQNTFSPKSAEHYILYEFDQVSPLQKLALTEIHNTHSSGSPYMAVSCTWDEILQAQ